MTVVHKLKKNDLQNDEIERLGLERSGLYRKCRLEEIKLPLVAGNLKNVPMEEVRHSSRFYYNFF